MPAARLPRIRLISGGQTGADRAALDLALEFGLPSGGWCPRGRRAEDGPIGARYPLRETAEKGYECRTARNVEEADATLIFTVRGRPLTGGTALTAEIAERLGKAWMVVEGAEGTVHAAARIRAFVEEHAVTTLNIAGPRAGGEAEVGELVRRTLIAALGLEEAVQWSVWLRPADPARSVLRQRIRSLAERHPPAVPFEPHLTLGSLPVEAFPAAGDAGARLGAKLASRLATVPFDPIRLPVLGVVCGPVFSRTCVLACEPDQALGRLVGRCAETLGTSFHPFHEPHLSLIYAILDVAEEAELLSRAKASIDEFEGSRLAFNALRIVRTSRPFLRPGQVAGWRAASRSCFTGARG